MPDTPPYDCQTCGACCVQFGPEDGNSYVYLDREEARRMANLGLPVIGQSWGGRCLGATPHEGASGRPACVAFAGELGISCACSIHEDRPSVCRDFEVGDALCQEARLQAGLSI